MIAVRNSPGQPPSTMPKLVETEGSPSVLQHTPGGTVWGLYSEGQLSHEAPALIVSLSNSTTRTRVAQAGPMLKDGTD